MNFQSHKKSPAKNPSVRFENLENRRLLAGTYLGVPFTTNQQIQAEFFDLGGEGAGFHDTTAANLGASLRLSEAVDIAPTTDAGAGFTVNNTAPGEWMAYTVTAPTTGLYYVETRVASANSGGSFHYEWDGRNVSGGIPVPNTGSENTFVTLKTGPISLTSGTHQLRLVMNFGGTASLGSFNWIRLTPYVPPTTGGGGTGGGGTGGGGTGGGGTGGGGTGGGTTVTNGLKATYFDNINFTGKTVSRTDSNVNFNFGANSPVSLIAPTTYSVRWTGKIKAPTTGRYTFFAKSDGGLRLWVNGKLLFSCSSAGDPTLYSGSINLTGGQKYDIKLEYTHAKGNAQISLSWSNKTMKKQIIPNSALFTG